MDHFSGKITTLVFSRNRAMQLDATLRSFFRHCQDADRARTQVLFLATDPQNAVQYQQLMRDYPEVRFFQQTRFQLDLETILDPFPLGSQQHIQYSRLCEFGRPRFQPGSLLGKVWKHTLETWQGKLIRRRMPTPPEDTYFLFLVDDNLFVRDFSIAESIRALAANPDALGVSLRLGTNTTYCYTHDRVQRLPAFHPLSGGLLKYDWTTGEHDFGYPLEVSSSIFRAREILPLVGGRNFRNPNDLEGYMAARSGWFRTDLPAHLCYEKSVTFCNPVNVVQTTTENFAGKQFSYSVAEMIERFDRGERIDIDRYAEFTPNACHQEVELFFRK